MAEFSGRKTAVVHCVLVQSVSVQEEVAHAQITGGMGHDHGRSFGEPDRAGRVRSDRLPQTPIHLREDGVAAGHASQEEVQHTGERRPWVEPQLLDHLHCPRHRGWRHLQVPGALADGLWPSRRRELGAAVLELGHPEALRLGCLR